MTSSLSLTNSVYEYPQEHGRTYHGYRAGSYHFPNDPTETDRLDFQFEILKYCFKGQNYFAPLSEPKFILDIGTGTGQWAIEMGDEFPDAKVEATDLSPIQPRSVPENVHFFVDDASEDDWVLPAHHYDYIHTRVLLGCFTDFRDILRKAFYYLKPGGYMESQEILPTGSCDDGTMPADWPFLDWMKHSNEAAMESGRPLIIAHKLKRWYEAVGFVDVQEKVFKLPLNPWPKDKHLKTLGEMYEHNWLSGLQGFTMAPFSRILNWNKNEIEVYLVNVRKGISDRRVHAYNKVYVVWGRKPDSAPQTSGISTPGTSEAHKPNS
ncbi:S-adenosyl-L-methionine-dependent methyltransferase [Tricladium varicosporioides]|nr:S-adenosyl-L-methionine-dependent methyltransferase [Hymenoscyphus varicosporioides]